MGEISINPKFNIHKTYKKVRILNPYRNSGSPAPSIASFIPTKASLFPNNTGTITGGFLDYENNLIAEKLEYSNNSNIAVFTGINMPSGNTTLVFSMEVKKGNLRYARVAYTYFTGSLPNLLAYFDFDTMSWVTTDSILSFQDLGNGWVRLILTGDATSSDNNGQYYIAFTAASNGASATVGDFGYIGRIQAIENDVYVKSLD